MSQSKTIKNRTHYLYSTEEFNQTYPQYGKILHWRSGKEREWVLTDDDYVVQILKKGKIKGGQQYIRCITGSYVTSGVKKMYGTISENIYTFSGTNEYRKFKNKTDSTSREHLFARYVSSGKDVVESYLDAYNTTNVDYAKQRAGKLLKTERVLKMITEETKKVLEEEGVSASYIIQKFKQVADIGDRDSDVLRSLECLAKISGLYDTQDTKKQELTVWGGFSPEQLKQVDSEQLIAHGEKEDG